GRGGERVTRAGFELRRVDDPSATPGVLLRDVFAADGDFVLRDLEPGRWSARIRPGGAFHAGDGRFRELLAELPIVARTAGDAPSGASGPLVREFTIEAAGGLHVAARDAFGAFLPARVELEREEAGAYARVAVELCRRGEDEFGRLEYVQATDDRASAEGESCVEPPLVPGRYRVRFDLD